jgi:hypothetical protein
MAEGMVLKGMSMSEVRAWHKLKLSIVVVNTKGAELGKTVRGIGRGA